MITWESIVTWNVFLCTSVSICPITMFFGKYLSISSRILFLCVINEIIMKVKLNKILFLNLCFGCVFFMRSLVCKARHR
jgi:hypothetical protein